MVVRNLPPGLTEEAFRKQIDARHEGSYDWLRYWKGRAHPKQPVVSRAYIHFKDVASIEGFCKDVHGHAYVDDRGAQYVASVLPAPFQKVPLLSRRRDPKQGSIHNDSDYKRFLARLEEASQQRASAEVQLDLREAEQKAVLAAHGGAEPVVMTPLMAYMKQKSEAKAAKRAKSKRKKEKKELKPGKRDKASSISGGRKPKGRLDKKKARGDKKGRGASDQTAADNRGGGGSSSVGGGGGPAIDQDGWIRITQGSRHVGKRKTKGAKPEGRKQTGSPSAGDAPPRERERQGRQWAKVASGNEQHANKEHGSGSGGGGGGGGGGGNNNNKGGGRRRKNKGGGGVGG